MSECIGTRLANTSALWRLSLAERNTQSTKRSFVRWVYFALKRRLAEGEIAACSALEFLKQHTAAPIAESSVTEHAEEVQRFLTQSGSRFTTEQLEEAMQTVMDAYAGGIKTNYRFNEKQLKIADEKIVQLMQLSRTAARR